MAGVSVGDAVQREDGHCQERGPSRQKIKEIRGKIQALKKSVPKGDKKRKKEVAVQISALEEEIKTLSLSEKDDRQAHTDACNERVDANGGSPASEAVPEEEKVVKLSKSQRKREKRARKENEREQRIEQAVMSEANNPRLEERWKLLSTLRPHRLTIKDVAPDGNCLYAAVSDQLLHILGEMFTVPELRRACAEHIHLHSDDFLPFLSDTDTGEPLGSAQFERYCDEIENTSAWGGQLELRALSHVYQAPITVYQADAPPLCISEEEYPKERTLRVSFHQHEYSLGQHYNSVVSL